MDNAPETTPTTEQPTMPRKTRDFKAEWARRKALKEQRAKGQRQTKATAYVTKNPSKAKPKSQLKHPSKKWTPEHLKNFQASMAKRRATGPVIAKRGGTKWTPERRKKFVATMKAKRMGMANGVGPMGGKRVGRPPKTAKPPDVWGIRSDGSEGWLTPILQQRWVYVPKPGT